MRLDLGGEDFEDWREREKVAGETLDGLDGAALSQLWRCVSGEYEGKV